MSHKKYRVKLKISYTVYIPATAESASEAIDVVDAVVGKSDDYDMVNRSESRTIEIQEITEDFSSPREKGTKIIRNKLRTHKK